MTGEWYNKYYGDKETEDFNKWWIKNYHRISRWDNNPEKYYDCRAYTLLGWLAALDSIERTYQTEGKI